MSTPLLQPPSGHFNFVVTLIKPSGVQNTFHTIFKDFFLNKTNQNARTVSSLSLKKNGNHQNLSNIPPGFPLKPF